MGDELQIQPIRTNAEMQPSRNRFSDVPNVRRGALPDVTIHQITDEELESLTRTRESDGFAWGHALLSVALALVIALFTASVTQRVLIAFVGSAALCFGAGIILVLTSIRGRQLKTHVIAKIRARLRGKE